ncbi:MAG: hypothetical protein Q9173_001593 [Seirophora scorigena]
MLITQRRSSTPWTRLAYFLAAFVLVGCLHSAVVSASPTRIIGRQDDEVLPNDDQGTDNVGSSGAPFDAVVPLEDKYPTFKECQEKCSVAKDKSLFFSQVGKFEDRPTDFAGQESLILVRGYTKFADGEDNYKDSKMARCGLENQPVPDPPSGAGTYQPGRCRVHVTQYQKNEPNFPSPNYRLDLTLYDDSNAVIGTNFGVDAPTNEYVGITSALPYVLLAATGEVDKSAVLFKYAGQEWGSNDQPHDCDFGGYEDGNRDGDCIFDCTRAAEVRKNV